MATQTIGPNRVFGSATDLSLKQFYIVKVSAANTVALASAATDFLVGTIQNKPVSSGSVEVAMRHGGGTAKVILGGTVSIGDNLTADSAGKAVATTSAGNEVLGRALYAGDAGDIIEYMPQTSKYAVT